LDNTIFFHRCFAKYVGFQAAKMLLLLGCTYISDSLQLTLFVSYELKVSLVLMKHESFRGKIAMDHFA